MNIAALDFSNGNNAALSLRVLAEKARSGDLIVTAEKKKDGSISIDAREKNATKKEER